MEKPLESSILKTTHKTKTGIFCKCGAKMGVYYTIPKYKHITRGRQCPKCGYIKQTTEK